MRLNRRVFLAGGVSAALWSEARGAPSPLPAGAKGVITLEAAAVSIALGASAPTPAMGFNGASPGPLLRAKFGAQIPIRFTNALDAPTCLSFPGLRAANSSMGFAGLTQAAIAPGKTDEIRLVPPDSGFNIYLPHAGRDTARQFSNGLYGPIIVDEAAPPAIDLEAIVILADWSLDPQGDITGFDDSKLARRAGRIGATVTANANALPLKLSGPPGGRVRLRLANSAAARTMTMAVAGGRMLIVAVDGQPSDAFSPLHDVVPMAPGARFELMFDLPREAGGAIRFLLRDEADRPLIVVECSGEPVPARSPLAGLPANPKLPPEIALERAKRVDLALTGGGDAPFAIKGATFVDWAPKPIFQVARGTPVTLGLVNKTAFPQIMRLNGHVARLLHALDDGWEPYWRDILVVPPGKTIRAAFVADNPGKWPIESVSPERRNEGLAGWFQVT